MSEVSSLLDYAEVLVNRVIVMDSEGVPEDDPVMEDVSRALNIILAGVIGTKNYLLPEEIERTRKIGETYAGKV